MWMKLILIINIEHQTSRTIVGPSIFVIHNRTQSLFGAINETTTDGYLGPMCGGRTQNKNKPHATQSPKFGALLRINYEFIA